MPHTNVYMNWTPVTITPLGGSAITLKEVTDLQDMTSDTLEPWQSDGNKFATVLVAASGSRGCTIVGGDCYKLQTIPRNTPCTIVAVLSDALNPGPSGSGSLTHTWLNAVISDTPISGPSNKYAGGSATFVCFSADGTTDPHSVAQTT